MKEIACTLEYYIAIIMGIQLNYVTQYGFDIMIYFLCYNTVDLGLMVHCYWYAN